MNRVLGFFWAWTIIVVILTAVEVVQHFRGSDEWTRSQIIFVLVFVSFYVCGVAGIHYWVTTAVQINLTADAITRKALFGRVKSIAWSDVESVVVMSPGYKLWSPGKSLTIYPRVYVDHDRLRHELIRHLEGRVALPPGLYERTF